MKGFDFVWSPELPTYLVSMQYKKRSRPSWTWTRRFMKVHLYVIIFALLPRLTGQICKVMSHELRLFGGLLPGIVSNVVCNVLSSTIYASGNNFMPGNILYWVFSYNDTKMPKKKKKTFCLPKVTSLATNSSKPHLAQILLSLSLLDGLYS